MPVPKSKIRAQSVTVPMFTQVAIVKSVRPPTTPGGSSTYWLASAPLSLMALPKPARPGTLVAGAGVGSPTSMYRPARAGGVVSTIFPVISPYHLKRA